MTLTNRILHVLRNGVAKNGKIVMDRMPVNVIIELVDAHFWDVRDCIARMVDNGLLGREGEDLMYVYWRKGKGCV